MATTAAYRVDGMTCDHCVRAVQEELRQLAGVHDVAVALVAGGTSTVTITSDAPIDPASVAAAIEEAGYALAAAA
jgi:copper chaperone CopZ